jgi:hypothetical protein
MINLFLILFFLVLIGIGGYFIYIKFIQKNVCDRGPQSKLNNKTCADISKIKMISPINNEQFIYMKKNGINVDELGYKYDGEDCWFNKLDNCISPTCVNENSVVNNDLIKCSIIYKIKKNPMALLDPWVINASKKYNINIDNLK